MGGGYTAIDNKITARLDTLVAVIKKKGKQARSELIFTEGRRSSRTTPKKISERIKGGKKTKRFF